MNFQEAAANLRTTLAFLYDSEADARRIARDAGLQVENIPFGSHANNNWHAILLQAQKEGKIEALMAATINDFRKNEKLLSNWEHFIQASGQTTGVASSMPVPPVTSLSRWSWIATIIVVAVAMVTWQIMSQEDKPASPAAETALPALANEPAKTPDATTAATSQPVTETSSGNESDTDITLVPTVINATVATDTAKSIYRESFEETHYWEIYVNDPDLAHHGALSVTSSTDHATDGSHSLKFEFLINASEDTGEADNQAIFEENSDKKYSSGNFDLSPYRYILIDVYNDTDQTLWFAWALTTSNDWVWHESMPVQLPPNALSRDITYDLWSSAFASESSNWENTDTLTNPEQLKKLSIIVFSFNPPPVEGAVFVDNLRLMAEE